VHAFATLLGETDAANLLEQTLQEEKETDQKLTELAQEINDEAARAGSDKDESETSEAKPKQKAARAGSSRQ
jgi:uncharacterized protein DUF892